MRSTRLEVCTKPRAICSIVLVAIGLCLATPAAEGRSRAGARAHHQGKRLFAAGRYEAAAQAFLRSYRASRHANALYSVGECYRRLGRLRESHRYYSAYAEALPEAKREAFTPKLDRLRYGKPSRLRVFTRPAGASISIGRRPRGRTTPDSALELQVTGGSHRLAARLAGHEPTSRQIVAEFGEPLEITLSLEPIPAPAIAPAARPKVRRAAPRARRSRRQRRLSWLVEAQAGPSIASYGDERFSAGVGAELGLHGGLLWRLGALAIGPRLSVSYAPIRDGVVGETGSALSVLAGGAARVVLPHRLWLAARLGVGATLLLGVSERHFLRAGGTGGSRQGLVLRPSIALGWRVRRGLTLAIEPALSYSPRSAGLSALAPTISGITRILIGLSIGWQAPLR